MGFDAVRAGLVTEETFSCRVWYRDREGGVYHGVPLRAVNRYHAFGLAMHKLRKCSWCNPDYNDVQRLTIQRRDGRQARGVVVERDEFEGWLNARQLRAVEEEGQEYFSEARGERPCPGRDSDAVGPGAAQPRLQRWIPRAVSAVLAKLPGIPSQLKYGMPGKVS